MQIQTTTYIVACAGFVNQSHWQKVTGVAILQYSNSKGKVTGQLPDPPNDFDDPRWSMNQASNVREDGTASRARSNPQGSFHYENLSVTDIHSPDFATIKVIGKRRATLNGNSFVTPVTPILLADLRFLGYANGRKGPRMDTSIINSIFKRFVEIVFQNNDTVMQSFHVDGFSFYVVRMDLGVWSTNKRISYNKLSAVYRCTVQVHPGAWTAVYAYLDNPGVWNIRTENLDSWYLGQETYVKIVSPETETSMFSPPDNALYCGQLVYLQRDPSVAPLISKKMKFLVTVLAVLLVTLVELW